MVLYWGFLIWGFSKPYLGIFYGSVDFRGFSIWGFSYTISDGRNGEGQSSHVPVLCVNLELWGIIVLTFKTPCYVYYSCIQFTIHMLLN